MNFLFYLKIFLLSVLVFTAPAQAMHKNQTEEQSFVARSLKTTKSALDRFFDVAIKYALLKPAQLWFEGQSKAEQERMVLESKQKSIAHESFKKLYGKEMYDQLLMEKKKAFGYKPVYANDNSSGILDNRGKPTQLRTLVIIFLLISPHFLPSVQIRVEENDGAGNDTALKTLGATFAPNNSICQTMFYLQHNINTNATPYNRDCYLVTSNGNENHSGGTFIGCNPKHNFDTTCFLVDRSNNVIFAQRIILTGKLSGTETYQCEGQIERIYEISQLENSTEIIQEIKAPSTIYGCSQFDLNADLEYIEKNNIHLLGSGWILAKNFDASTSTNLPLCLLRMLGHIMQSFNQKTLGDFFIS